MADFVVMPKMNLTMEEGLLSRWLVSEGQTINKGDIVCSVENEKETGDVESIYGGVVAKLIGAEYTVYKVNEPLCVIAQPGEDIVAALAELEARRAANEARAIEAHALKAAEARAPDYAMGAAAAHGGYGAGAGAQAGGGAAAGAQTNVGAFIGAPPLQKTVILPKIRKIIKQKGIGADEIAAEYGNKKITESDVLEFEKKYAAFRPKPNDTIEKLSPMRLAVSRNMKRSVDATARLTNFIEADITGAVKKLAECKAAGETLSVTAVFVKAAALALRGHKICNAVYDDLNKRIIYRGDINVGFAVDVENGLVVPVVRGADQKSVYEISDEIRRLSKAAQEGRLASADTDGGTFTVTSVGMYDTVFFTPIINYPQSAILAVGAVQTLPRYIGSDFSSAYPRKIVILGVTYDHRLVNGAPAARFLQSVRDALQDCNEIFDF